MSLHGLLSSWRGTGSIGLGWPNRCAVCHSGTCGADGRLCAPCRVRFAAARPRCARCAARVPEGVSTCGACLKHPPDWSGAIAACDYAYPWDALLSALKFRESLDLAPALGDLLADAVRRAAPVDSGDAVAFGVDTVLPVPLGARRLRARGYNQAALLAKRVARRLGIACEPRWLLRLTETDPQSALPRADRASNVRGAFAVEPLALASLRGRRVALLDDVLTTGATLGELARMLRARGAADVRVWVVARTPA